MIFYFLTIHPKFIAAYSEFGVMQSAIRQGLAHLRPIDLRQFAVDRHGSIDDHPYGGGDGMILRPEPIRDALHSIGSSYVINASPRGKPWTQSEARRLGNLGQPLTFLCGRFGGIDQRTLDLYVQEEFSLGDFVLSGGELPCLAMADSILRLVPGTLGNSESPEVDSFSPAIGNLLEHDLYTRPPCFEGREVPAELLSGNHELIRKWREANSLAVTSRRRPDLLKRP